MPNTDGFVVGAGREERHVVGTLGLKKLHIVYFAGVVQKAALYVDVVDFTQIPYEHCLVAVDTAKLVLLRVVAESDAVGIKLAFFGRL